jgi:hypothetical protein
MVVVVVEPPGVKVGGDVGIDVVDEPSHSHIASLVIISVTKFF